MEGFAAVQTGDGADSVKAGSRAFAAGCGSESRRCDVVELRRESA